MGNFCVTPEILMLAKPTATKLLELSGPRTHYPEAPLRVIAKDVYVDLILADGNSLETLDRIADPDANFDLTIKDSVMHRNTLQLNLHLGLAASSRQAFD